MKKEKKELRLPFDIPQDTCRRIIEQYKQEDWALVGSRSEIVLTLEREIPDTPTEQETKIANIGDSCSCCNDESQPPTDAWDDEDASSEPPTENVQEALRKVSEQMELEEVASPTPAEDHHTQRDWPI